MELTTKTGSDVAAEVKRLFGDEDGVQIVDTDLVKWINGAQRKIVSLNPILQRSLVRDSIAGQSSYEFPTDRVQYVQSISYKGIPLQAYTYQEAQAQILADGPPEVGNGGTPIIWWSWAQAIYLWPIPDTAEVGGLTMDYVAIPEDLVAISDMLSVPDRYFDAIVEQVMMKAHILDENWDAAGFAKGMFGESLSQLSEQENRVRINTYPTITVRPEDL